MAKHSKLGTRYAKAIFDFLGSSDKARDIVVELALFSDALDAHKELEQVCCSDAFGTEDRTSIVADVAGVLKLSNDSVRILSVISEAKRVSYVKEIAESLRLLALEASGVLPVEVQSAADLSDSEKEKVAEKFSKILGKPVEASFEKVPALKGGLRVIAGGKTYDGSVATRLAALKEQMLGGY